MRFGRVRTPQHESIHTLIVSGVWCWEKEPAPQPPPLHKGFLYLPCTSASGKSGFRPSRLFQFRASSRGSWSPRRSLLASPARRGRRCPCRRGPRAGGAVPRAAAAVSSRPGGTAPADISGFPLQAGSFSVLDEAKAAKAAAKTKWTSAGTLWEVVLG